MNEVRRYKHAPRLVDMVVGQPAPMPPGEYVLASDYDALADRLSILGKDFTNNQVYTGQLERTNADMRERITELERRLVAMEQERDAFKAQSKCMYCGAHHFTVAVCSKCTFSKPAAEPFKISQLQHQVTKLREAVKQLLAVRGQVCDGVAVPVCEQFRDRTAFVGVCYSVDRNRFVKFVMKKEHP